MNNRYLRSALMFAVVAVILMISSVTASAALKPKDPFMWGENYYLHDYGTWDFIKGSFLVPVDDGYMRVQSGWIYAEDLLENPEDDIIGVEYYDKSFNRIGKKYMIIEPDLPVFGGFAEHDGYYYIVSGQSNHEESDSCEVVRITKYDRDWNRVGSAGLYGSDTSTVFSYGTLDIAWSGDIMFVHTCHEMYKSEDGKNHQANFSFYLDVNKMDEIKRAYVGYASHSFGQRVCMDGDIAVTVDHGDATPRGIDLSVNNLKTEDIDGAMILEAAEKSNYRSTGMKLGDLQISDTSYLVAGASADQEKGGTGRQDIFVGAVDKKSMDVKLRWFRDSAAEGQAQAPYLVKVSEDRFILMWNDTDDDSKNAEKSASLKCICLNGEGEAVSEIYSLTGVLSDCEPVISDGQVVWYTYKAEKILFYTMPVSDPSQLKCVKRKWKKLPHIKLKNSKSSVKHAKYSWNVWAFNDKLDYDCPYKLIRFSGKGMNRKSRKVLNINRKTGYIKVKAGAKIGTYKMKVTVKCIGSKTYLSEKKSAIVTIKVTKKKSSNMY